MQPLYDPDAVKPMWEELAGVGIQPLTRPEEVDGALGAAQGTTMLVINSVCGCAAGGARPGVTLALQHDKIPDRSVTVFAGVDRLAVDRARAYLTGIMPSSPFIALFKDGKLVHALERRHIEQMDARTIALNLAEAFEKHCEAQGPSVPPEVYEKNVKARQCGSTVPQFRIA